MPADGYYVGTKGNSNYTRRYKTLVTAKKYGQAQANKLDAPFYVTKVMGMERKSWTLEPKRTKNPTITTSTLPIGEWSPAHAIRRNADGTVDILREKNSGKRRANISEGFMSGGVFHPIRSAADYDASRVGESKGKKRKAPARKKASTKRAMATSRRDYGGDGSRYRNAGKGAKWALIKDGTAKPLSIYHSKTDANTAWKHLSGKYPKGKSPYWVEKYNW